MSWEIVIGLETHAQLSTASKMFSGASTAFGAAPNTQASAVDIALPGVLPVVNEGAVERAIRFGLAVGGKINRRSVFARKNYFYPDLPKGYQISQYELPIVQGGEIRILTRGEEKSVQLTRAHLEEDAGKSLHEDLHGMSGIDLNRAGTPLLEIVSEPVMHSAEDAVAYAKTLHSLVQWIGICDGNMQEGSFRCDANVSVRRPGGPLGTRAEIKNLNSFRFLERAIEYEVKRQIEILEGGGKIVQETRLYDPDRDETRSMRTKEDAQDYRYFPDPDLLPLEVSEEWINEIRAELPEWPQDRLRRFKSYGLSDYDAALLNADFDIGDYFDGVVRESMRSGEQLGSADFKLCANWVLNDVAARRNADGLQSWQFGVSDETLGYMLRLLRDGVIGAKTVKDLFAEFWEESKAKGFSVHGGHPVRVDELIEERGLRQISDSRAIEKIVDEVLAANAKQVEDYRAGKDKAFNSLVGQVMKATKGKANPAQVNEILKRKLGR
jgi:aspartyl-tRNA(Asn)/glutamyl-tRNA(Gln) amidotransferase subunit B